MLRLCALAILLCLTLLGTGAGARQRPDFTPAGFYGLPAPALRGPAAAQGLVIWSHGTDALADIDRAPVVAWYFAQTGWDVYRLYRGPDRDRRHSAASSLQDAIGQARQMGYERIVLIGHSAGAYAAVETAQHVPVTGVIALAPAAFGHRDNGMQFHLNDHAMRPFWRRLATQPVRIAAAYFPQDIFYEDDVPATRGPWLRQLLQQQATSGEAAHLVIDRPELRGINGHSSGLGWSFARRYAPCIHRLMEGRAEIGCDASRPEETAIFARAASQAGGEMAAPYIGRWREMSGRRDATGFDILRDPLGMPLLSFTMQEHGSSDWPIRITSAQTARSETAAGQFELQRDGTEMTMVLHRPGHAAQPQLRWRLQREAADPQLAGLAAN